MTESLVGGASAVPLSMRVTAVVASAIVSAARQLLTDLEQGGCIDAAVLRNAMQAAFGGSDATGAWNWKIAYDACEAATVLFLRRHGAAMRAKAPSPAAMLSMLMRITALLPTETRRSEESDSLQLRRVRIMGAYPIELSGFTDTMHDRLRAYGLFGEIISWKLRMFVPTDASGGDVLAKVLDHYAIEAIAEREVA
jgi:hypothetical protein